MCLQGDSRLKRTQPTTGTLQSPKSPATVTATGSTCKLHPLRRSAARTKSTQLFCFAEVRKLWTPTGLWVSHQPSVKITSRSSTFCLPWAVSVALASFLLTPTSLPPFPISFLCFDLSNVALALTGSYCYERYYFYLDTIINQWYKHFISFLILLFHIRILFHLLTRLRSSRLIALPRTAFTTHFSTLWLVSI